ncbi:DUF7882 family protein [Agromyces cerinus]|uniref:DUF7882 domain-containing protein n=1 Tax=Agromyces cerinus subsp. cerinus TaxID=232089 RepID=A0A1N6DWI0_9MICO|nr:hypothetical protein [Agromyces cerinus]SIN75063.1 hypothetical protein SAMN05443544_0813 [Agromyces cerinus subsp. cerinus]
MGQLIYGTGTRYDMEDRTLSHVKVAVGAKLRRHESFFLSWIIPADHGSGRVSIWLSDSIPLQFHFNGNTPPELNRTWVKALELTTLSDRGMIILPEGDAEAFITSHPA